MKIKRQQSLTCPHCFFDYQESVEDFAIPSNATRPYAETTADEQCSECHKWFNVTQISKDEFEVLKGKIE